MYIYCCVIVYICVFDSSSSDADDDGRTCAWARLCIRDPHNLFGETLIVLGIFHSVVDLYQTC